MKSAVITGVSTGIGLSCAQLLTEAGWQVFGSVRSAAAMDKAAQTLGERFVPLQFDITDRAAVERAAALVRERLGGQRLLALVNNAGVAVPGPLTHQPIDEFRSQMEINLVGPLSVTQVFLPLLGMDPALTGPPGRIVNISSAGGRIAAPFLGAYSASKHAMEGLSESLRRELMLYGIDVIIVAPGAVATPIWDKAEDEDVARYAQTDYVPAMTRFKAQMIKDGRNGLPPRRIAEVVLQALGAERPAVRYAVVPRPLMNWWLPNALPRRVVDRAFAKQLGLDPAAKGKGGG